MQVIGGTRFETPEILDPQTPTISRPTLRVLTSKHPEGFFPMRCSKAILEPVKTPENPDPPTPPFIRCPTATRPAEWKAEFTEGLIQARKLGHRQVKGYLLYIVDFPKEIIEAPDFIYWYHQAIGQALENVNPTEKQSVERIKATEYEVALAMERSHAADAKTFDALTKSLNSSSTDIANARIASFNTMADGHRDNWNTLLKSCGNSSGNSNANMEVWKLALVGILSFGGGLILMFMLAQTQTR